jgi:uncharacterized protein (TIGR03437 family)
MELLQLAMAHRLTLLLFALSSSIFSQIPDNRSLAGKYYFRHLQLSVQSPATIQSAATLTGSAVFDGNGKFSFTGQQVTGMGAPVTLVGNGTYSIQPNGLVTLSNPQQTNLNMNARLGAGVLVGSTTDGGGNAYDVLIAIPAATAQPSLTGTYWVSSLDFQNATSGSVRNAFFKVSPSAGSFGNISASGQAANLGAQTLTQTITGATYTIANDGSGTANFPIPGNTATSGQLVSGAKTLYVAPDGSLFIAGSTSSGGQDLMVGVKALKGTASAATLKDLYFTAGLRFDGEFNASAGAANSGGQGKLVVSKRVRTSSGPVDLTAVNSYTVNPDGSGTGPELNSFALGAAGQAFVGSGTAIAASGVYEIYFGIRAPAVTGAGVFLNPLGIVNAASFAPVGASLSPGEFITLFGSGLSNKTDVAQGTTYGTALSGVEVTINDIKAPVYAVSAGQLNVLVPFGTTGSSATIVVNNNGTKSNSVTVPLSKTSPGIFTVPPAGIGPGAVLHADFSLVSAAKPAKVGETILIFLTGLGAVTPTVADGAPPNILTNTTATVNVYFGGVVAKPLYKGLSPQYPGLYQVNVTVPKGAPTGNAISLAIETPDAFHDQVDIALAP